MQAEVTSLKLIHRNVVCEQHESGMGRATRLWLQSDEYRYGYRSKESWTMSMGSGPNSCLLVSWQRSQFMSTGMDPRSQVSLLVQNLVLYREAWVPHTVHKGNPTRPKVHYMEGSLNRRSATPNFLVWIEQGLGLELELGQALGFNIE